jgi:hypothetical protein
MAGLLSAAATLGLQSLLIRPKRLIGDFEAQITIEEQHEDVMEITEQPVEIGAKITDHSYTRPATLTIQCGWSNSPSSQSLLGSLSSAVSGTIGGVNSILNGNSVSQVKQIYADLLTLQKSRIPFDVVTGKRAYSNMLVKSLKTTTSKDTENSLIITATFQQIIMVSVNMIQFDSPADAQKDPQTTNNYSHEGLKNLNPAKAYNASAGRR